MLKLSICALPLLAGAVIAQSKVRRLQAAERYKMELVERHDVFAPFGGFGERTLIRDGHATLSDSPGIGFENKPELMDVFGQLESGS